MIEEVMQNRRLAPPVLCSVNTKLVAKVAIVTSLAAALLLLFLQLPPVAQWLLNFTQSASSMHVGKVDLVPALLVIGISLTCIVGLTTWLVVLYNSFRVAGPLYRFSRDLELMSGLPEFRGFRNEDCLQELSHQFRLSANVMKQHYQELDRLLVEALACIDSGEQEQLADRIKSIEELLARVRVG